MWEPLPYGEEFRGPFIQANINERNPVQNLLMNAR
jgi:hypothetical protein